MSTDKEIEAALEDQMKLIALECGKPRDVWHPDFGWVLRNGMPTDTTEAFQEFLISKQRETRLDECKK